MICKNCKKTIPDDCTVCPSCGQDAPGTPAAPSGFRPAGSLDYRTTQDTPKPESYSELRFSRNLQETGVAPVVPPEPSPAELPTEPLAEPPIKKTKGKKIGIFAAAGVALLIAVVLIVGFATNWFDLTNPGDKIATALKNTFAAENFTIRMEATYIDDDGSKDKNQATFFFSMDPEAHELTLYATANENNEGMVIAIYDGYFIRGASGYYFAENIQDELDDFFENCDISSEDFSLKDLLDTVLREEFDEDEINFKKLDSCLSDYFENLNSKRWLKDNAGFSTKREDGVTLYCFKPDVHRFLKASLPVFKKAFADKELYEEATEAIADLKEVSKETDIEITLGVEDEQLVSLEFDISSSEDGLTEGVRILVSLDFEKIGSTKVDTELLAYLLSQANIYR